jgi:voltage-gated potassium channel
LRLNHVFGLAGVAAHETPAARKWGRALEWPMLLVALWIPVQWYLEAKAMLPARLVRIDDWLIWVFFAAETSLLSALVRDRRAYLKTNWLNLLIIIAGVPMLWNYTPLAGMLRNLRLLLLLALILRFFPSVREVLRRNQLGLTLAVAGVVVVVSGIILSAIDPGVPTIEDGIWYAWVTLATVGYGDIVPTSGAGRLIGAVLILMGIGLFSLLTANLAAFLLSSDVEKVEREETIVIRRLDALQAQLNRIEHTLGEHRQTISPADGQAVNADQRTHES